MISKQALIDVSEDASNSLAGVHARSLPDTRGGKRTTGFGWEGVVPNLRRQAVGGSKATLR
jgi:hypothetical protein